jgi:hypothetical protein
MAPATNVGSCLVEMVVRSPGRRAGHAWGQSHLAIPDMAIATAVLILLSGSASPSGSMERICVYGFVGEEGYVCFWE